jgi:hypothetical protein
MRYRSSYMSTCMQSYLPVVTETVTASGMVLYDTEVSHVKSLWKCGQ